MHDSSRSRTAAFAARDARSTAAREQLEAVIESLDDFLGAQNVRARRGQLDRQRNPVQVRAKLCYVGRIPVSELESCVQKLCAGSTNSCTAS